MDVIAVHSIRRVVVRLLFVGVSVLSFFVVFVVVSFGACMFVICWCVWVRVGCGVWVHFEGSM